MDWRRAEEKLMKVLMVLSTSIVVGSFFVVLATIFIKGISALNLDMIIKSPSGGYYIGKEGGILNAILGSILLGAIAITIDCIICIPLVLYLNLYLGKKSRFGYFIRFLLDLMWGIPSIVYGAFGFTIMVFFGLRASLLAGSITVAMLILPLMARGMDEVLKMIPLELKEASYAMGATRLETALKVVARQALPGMITAVLISFGRGIGDAASVLFTASFTDSLPYSLFEPVATLPLAIFFQLATPFPEVQARGYASALILTVLVLATSIISRALTKRFTRHGVK